MIKMKQMRNKRFIACTTFAVLIGTFFSVPVLAAPGDLIATINVPNASPSCCGIGVAVDCGDSATIFYTNSFSAFLHKMDKFGGDLGSIPLTRASDSAAISFGAISWDESRQRIWGGTDASGNPLSVYLIDPVTGVATFIFTLDFAGFGFCDGIGFDGTDNSIWVSDDVSSRVEHWDVSAVDAAGVGAAVAHGGGHIIPTNAAGGTLGAISGVAVGKGNRLYLGQDGRGKIVAVTKTGTFISDFATAAGRDEGLACDVVSFAPLEVLWSKDAFDDFVEVFEVEEGTCECPGGLFADIDIKPQSCPNPLNVKKNGVLPVAVLGGDDFDINDIDRATVQLEGVPSEGRNLTPEDVATPFGGELCDCDTLAGDGFTDQVFMFDAQAIVAALGAVTNREERELTLTGNLLDGTPFTGKDCVRIIVRGKSGNHKTETSVLPKEFSLNQNYPNPFNPSTKISLRLPESANWEIVIYNIQGQKVDRYTGHSDAGVVTIEWDGSAYASGIYFYKASAGSFSQTRKMTLLK
ncbi:MAG: T9SS type A sorting domain-containing protein [candidate division Zixibacteria bacterium]|nr:T9SS type A sorting domain-containing protein [candidate division Zixibacteria bacterium]